MPKLILSYRYSKIEVIELPLPRLKLIIDKEGGVEEEKKEEEEEGEEEGEGGGEETNK